MREMIIEELERSAAIIMSGNEVVPRFRIAVPGDIDHIVLVPLPDALDDRQRRLSLVSGFMAGRAQADSSSRPSWPSPTPPPALPCRAPLCSAPSD